jgi:hypothetical protein
MVSTRPILPGTSELASPPENPGDASRSSGTGEGDGEELTSIGLAAAVPGKDDGDGISPLALVLGILAATSLVVLGGLEASRRIRHA